MMSVVKLLIDQATKTVARSIRAGFQKAHGDLYSKQSNHKQSMTNSVPVEIGQGVRRGAGRCVRRLVGRLVGRLDGLVGEPTGACLVGR
jgi:hypothetical protein